MRIAIVKMQSSARDIREAQRSMGLPLYQNHYDYHKIILKKRRSEGNSLGYFIAKRRLVVWRLFLFFYENMLSMER